MKGDSKLLVLFYPTGIIHFRNLEILKKAMPGYRFLVIVEPWIHEKAPEVLDDTRKDDRIEAKNNRLPDDVWNEPVDMLFMFMAYPNRFRAQLLYEAARRNIPAVALEEVNQLGLNNGTINHYFLPLDCIGVASPIEKSGFVELGAPEHCVEVTGWPFFSGAEAWKSYQDSGKGRQELGIPPGKKSCLLVLGSLKENDKVSRETFGVRKSLLEHVSEGLSAQYQLMVKPHPVDTDSSWRGRLKEVPGIVVIDPKHPIEPLLALADLVVSRGNSQIALLAMLRQKPLIVVPEGLTTIFHGTLDSVISNSKADFRRILSGYEKGKAFAYEEILKSHLPLSREESLLKIKELFQSAPGKATQKKEWKTFLLSIQFAFLGDVTGAKIVAEGIPSKPRKSLLEKLFDWSIEREEFIALLDYYPEKIIRWHLQALFIRMLLNDRNKDVVGKAVRCLEGFDGSVNPHYFIDDILGRIELEYLAGRRQEAEELFDRFHGEYSVISYYRQAFDMLRSVYRGHGRNHNIRKKMWLLFHINHGYSRSYLKNKLRRSLGSWPN